MFWGELRYPVVPHVGTWIEMPNQFLQAAISSVVPHVGTWIEIVFVWYNSALIWSCLT